MRLNQVVALVKGKKTRIQQLLTTVHRGWAKERVAGISRTYTPTEENGENLQPEHRSVQLKVPKELARIRAELTDFYNVIATQELGNMSALAAIKIDGREITENIPVPLLLFFEKQMTDLRTLIEKLPTLPTDKVWRHDEAKDDWVTEPETTVKTQKKVEVIVKYDATPEHPAQTDLHQVDRTVGHWETIHLSGALPEAERARMLLRVTDVQDAIKIAREEANSTEVTMSETIGDSILSYIM